MIGFWLRGKGFLLGGNWLRGGKIERISRSYSGPDFFEHHFLDQSMRKLQSNDFKSSGVSVEGHHCISVVNSKIIVMARIVKHIDCPFKLSIRAFNISQKESRPQSRKKILFRLFNYLGDSLCFFAHSFSPMISVGYTVRNFRPQQSLILLLLSVSIIFVESTDRRSLFLI